MFKLLLLAQTNHEVFEKIVAYCIKGTIFRLKIKLALLLN